MPEGPLGGVTNFAVLQYQIGIEPPINKSIVEIENIAADVVDDNILPDASIRDVEAGRVQEAGVALEDQDLSVTVETTNVTTSNVTLNEIESDMNDRVMGRVTIVSVQAKLSGPVRRLVSRVMD